MDIVAHGVEGVILHTAIGLGINCLSPIGAGWVTAIGLTGLIGVVPDLDKRYGEWYISMHKGRINRWLRWIPAWGAHTQQDIYTHNDEEKGVLNNRWYASKSYKIHGDAKFWEYFVPSQYAEKMYWQSISWIINITIITIWLIVR